MHSSQFTEVSIQIALELSQENFVKQAVREGRYASEAEVVTLGLRMVEEHDRKLAELRAMIAASIAEGGAFTAEEMDADMEEQCKQLHAEGIPW